VGLAARRDRPDRGDGTDPQPRSRTTHIHHAAAPPSTAAAAGTSSSAPTAATTGAATTPTACSAPPATGATKQQAAGPPSSLSPTPPPGPASPSPPGRPRAHPMTTRGRGIQAIPADLPVACWLPIKPGLTVHGLRHGHKTWMEMSGVASDASFPGMREDGAIRRPGPCSPTAAWSAWRETAGQHGRVRTGLRQAPRCGISFCKTA
jgi:hypothetical protein